MLVQKSLREKREREKNSPKKKRAYNAKEPLQQRTRIARPFQRETRNRYDTSGCRSRREVSNCSVFLRASHIVETRPLRKQCSLFKWRSFTVKNCLENPASLRVWTTCFPGSPPVIVKRASRLPFDLFSRSHARLPRPGNVHFTARMKFINYAIPIQEYCHVWRSQGYRFIENKLPSSS